MTTNTKKKKSAREKRVIVASLIVAAVMIGGSTFAWFTSKDEVTNRLSASADYNVAIAEDFTPPNNWVPGQKVDKNVGFVNTGNVDAFVRSYLQGEMRVLNETSTAVETWSIDNKKFTDLATDVLETALTDVTDETLLGLNLNYSVTSGGKTYYLRALKKAQLDNPTTQTPSTNPDAYSEVMMVQAGGELVYTTGTKFTYTPNQSLTVHDSDDVIQNIVAGQPYTVTVGTNAKNITVDNTAHTILVSDIKYLPSIDSDSFKPATSGLYVFRRNTDLNTDLTKDDMEFSGYFYAASVADETATGATPGAGAYLKLHNGVATATDTDGDRSDYTLPKTAFTATYTASTNTWAYEPTTSLQLYTAERNTVENAALTWTYTAPVATSGSEKQGYLTATSGDIKVNVYLSNIKTNADIASNGTGKDDGMLWGAAGAESWTPIAATAGTPPITFYYNNDLEEGCSTERLVDSVELDSSVTQSAYLAFDFDLNVFMESVQVTVDESGKETYTAVNPWAITAEGYSNNNGAVAAKVTTAGYNTTNTNEIDSITWEYNS